MTPFSQTYFEARDEFRRVAVDAGGQIRSVPVPAAVGPNGEPLHVDIARFGPANAQSVLLCVSGVHGAEGFPGSAAQIDWIERCGLTLASDRDAPDGGLAVWMVHALNPFGFAWLMRLNENNVDLNRNWIDFSVRPPDNAGFAEIYTLVRPRAVDADTLRRVQEGLLELVARDGEAAVESTLTKGQYSHPDAMSFGGAKPEFARSLMTRLVHEDLRDARRVAYVDFHSGTQNIGELLFLCFSDTRSAEFHRAARWWGSDNLDPAAVEEKWGGRRPDRHGLMFTGLEALFGDRAGFAGAVVEFGTLEPEDRATPIMAAIYESWLRFEGDYHAPDAEPLKALMRGAFDRTGDKAWERKVIEGGRFVLDRALSGLKSWAAE